jgi:hypothetical protein
LYREGGVNGHTLCFSRDEEVREVFTGFRGCELEKSCEVFTQAKAVPWNRA